MNADQPQTQLSLFAGEKNKRAVEILSNLEPGEPFFVFRAKDILSTMALDEYAKLVERYGPLSDQLQSIGDAIHAFQVWQRNNPDKVKLPD